MADDATFQVWQDEEVAIALTASDPEDDPLAFVVGSPAHGVLTGEAPDLVYTPDPGFTGSDAFTFTVDDGTSVSSTAVVTISVMVPAALPCQDATRTIDAGTSLSVSTWLAAVPALCTAPGGAVVTVDGTPTAGSGSIDGAGVYTPPSGFLGTDLVTVGVVAGGGAARGTATLAVSVIDPDAPTGVGIGIGDATVYEGDTRTRTLIFPVSLPVPSAATVTVRYLISGVDAVGGTLRTPDVDFGSKGSIERTLTFRPGQVFRTISVTVYGDTRLETDESLTVTLSSPTGGVAISDAIGVGTIRDDDGVAGVQLAVGDAAIIEGDVGFRTATVPLTLSEPVVGPVTVEYRIELIDATGNYSSGPVPPGTDVRDLRGSTVSVTFPASPVTGLSTTQHNVALRVFGDTDTEPAERVEIHLLSVTAGADIVDADGLVTILDDDLPLGTIAVRGTVTDTAGRRVAGALVGACVGFTCASTYTGADGEYSFADVQAQFAAMPGWTIGAVVVVPPNDGTFRLSGYTVLARTPGLQVRDLALEIGGRFEPSLLTPAGDPAPAECAGGHVVIAAQSGTDDPRLSLFGNDFDGDRHHVGDYTVRVSPPAACPFQRSLATGTITAGATSVVAVTLAEPSTVGGIVRDPNGDPRVDAEVQVVEDPASLAPWAGSGTPAGFGAFDRVTTGPDGRYTTTGLPVGTFTLQVHRPAANGVPFVASTPGSTVTVDVDLTAAATVSGTLLGTDGLPLAGVSLVVFCPSPPATSAALGCAGGATAYATDGAYSTSLNPGTYRLVGGTMSQTSPQALLTVVAAEVVPCDIVAGSPGSVSCDESPPPAPKGHLQGTVLSVDGSVLSGLVGIVACPAATYAVPSVGCTGGALTIASGVDGAFGMDLDVGEYRVFGGTMALPSPYTTVTISEGGTVACEIRTGTPGSISCS